MSFKTTFIAISSLIACPLATADAKMYIGCFNTIPCCRELRLSKTRLRERDKCLRREFFYEHPQACQWYFEHTFK